MSADGPDLHSTKDQTDLLVRLENIERRISLIDSDVYNNITSRLDAAEESIISLKHLTDKIQNEKISLTSDLREIKTSNNILRSLVEQQENEQNEKISSLDIKIGSVSAMVLRKMETVRSQYEKHFLQQTDDERKRSENLSFMVKELTKLKNEFNEHSAEQKEKELQIASELDDLSTDVNLLLGIPSALLVSSSWHRNTMGSVFEQCRKNSQTDSTNSLNHSEYEIKSTILTFPGYYNIHNYAEIDYDLETGVLKVTRAGVYLVDIDVTLHLLLPPSEMYLSFVLREDGRTLKYYDISCVPLIQGTGRFTKIISLRKDDELCLYVNEFHENNQILKGQFACIRLF